jgi:hypothetical protein
MIPQHRARRLLSQVPQEPRPEPGDIVIGPAEGSPTGHALRVAPRPFQIACATYDEALAHARAFAARERVDVWVAEDKGGFALVARYRWERTGTTDRSVIVESEEPIDAAS